MSTARLLARIRREFQDHPGIVVTLPQAQSRWSLDKSHCTQAFEALDRGRVPAADWRRLSVARTPLRHTSAIALQTGVSLIHCALTLASRVQPRAASALTAQANELPASDGAPSLQIR